mmetsp:Transcript_28054/g.39956  ORF Transcript_28054/g.39956 Transcript_28054/m.39956 type:complete len:496 (+) Transcript_28054:21-1508(+)
MTTTTPGRVRRISNTGISTLVAPDSKSYLMRSDEESLLPQNINQPSSKVTPYTNFRTLICCFLVSFIIVGYWLVERSRNSIQNVQPFNSHCGINEAELVLLKNSNTSLDIPRCLDGSSPAYYIRRGFEDGEKKWVIHFEGGGWCYDLEACYLRSQTILGSSKKYSKCVGSNTLKFYMSHLKKENPLMHNWNTVLVKYCDASSYAGNAVNIFEGNTLYFKGQLNRDATIHHLLHSSGMNSASQVVLSGCSAGGLGVYLGIDQMASIVKAANPNTIVRGLSDSGFFLPHSSNQLARVTHLPFGRDEASVNGKINYAQAMRTVFQFANMTAGTHPECLKHAKNTKRAADDCVFAEHVARFIQTPTFALQPQYDQWQIIHVIGKNYSNEEVNEFGAKIVSKLKSQLLESSSLHGAFVDSCGHHCTSCSDKGENVWHGDHIQSTLDYHQNKKYTAAEAFSSWYAYSMKKPEPLTRNWPQRFFMQNFSFPCTSCCLCRVYH